MKFWDREKEKEWLKRYLKTEPNAILFVYGPKSSGKTSLLMKAVEELPKEKFIYYWYDLREKLVSGYESVIDLFFKEKGWLKSLVDAISPKIRIGVFELDASDLERFLKKRLDPFEEMRKQLERDRKKGITPVIVFDELQKLKEVFLNGDSKQRPLVRELFNFFVRITKVLHLAHVIVMTSDTFFIEQVYTDSTLVNTSIFYLVDFFDDETAVKVLISEGFDDEEATSVVKKIGGVPWMMERIVLERSVSEVENLYRFVKGTFGEVLGDIYEEGWYEEAVEVLKRVLDGSVKARGKDREVVRKLVGKEILFYDSIEGKVRFQTRLHEKAARELLEAG